MTVRSNKQTYPGYKKTQVGWIPEDWECRPFTEVFSRISDSVEVNPELTYREIGIRSHGKGVFFKEPLKGLTLGEKRVFRCQPGSLCFNIVFAWEQAIALLGPECEDYIASHRFPMFKPKGTASTEFYLWFFKSKRGKHGLTLASPGGAGRNKTLGQGELDFLFVPVPPMKEQHRIISVLATWDRAIESAERLLMLKEKRRRALMQQLLNGKRRFSEFKGKWTNEELGNLVDFVVGKTPSRSEQQFWAKKEEAGFYWATIADLREPKVLQTKEKITAEAVTKCRMRQFSHGSLLVTFKLTIGRVAWAAVDLYTNEAIAQVTPKTKSVGIDYLFHALPSALLRSIPGQAVKGKTLNQEQLVATTIRIPLLKEQRRISNVLNNCDEELGQLRAQVTALKKQKLGLMQQLLAGKVRVQISTE